MSINSVVIIGRLTKDPEIRKTQSGISICSFTIAVDRPGRKDSQGNTEHTADFIPCIVWRQGADYLTGYGEKGSIVAVNGNIQTGSYKNKDGQTVYTWNVNVQNVQLLSYKNSERQQKAEEPESQRHEAAASPENSTGITKQAAPADPYGGDNLLDAPHDSLLDISSDDLPF